MTWLHWIAAALGVSAFSAGFVAVVGGAAKRWPIMEGRGRTLVSMQVGVAVLWIAAMAVYVIADLSRS